MFDVAIPIPNIPKVCINSILISSLSESSRKLRDFHLGLKIPINLLCSSVNFVSKFICRSTSNFTRSSLARVFSSARSSFMLFSWLGNLTNTGLISSRVFRKSYMQAGPSELGRLGRPEPPHFFGWGGQGGAAEKCSDL